MLSRRPFHTATVFSKCHLSLACAIFLQDLDPCLAYKASSGYLLSFVLNISNEKRQEVKELIELKNRPRSMSRNLYILVITCRKYIRMEIFVLRLLISSFSSLLAYNVFVLVFCNFFICNHKSISESSLYAILWNGVYTRNTFTFPIFWLCNKLEILSASFSSKSQMPGQVHC